MRQTQDPKTMIDGNVLVTRLARNGLTQEVLYVDARVRFTPQQLLGKGIDELGLPASAVNQCRQHFSRVLATAAKETFLMFMGEKTYQMMYLPEIGSTGQVETVLAFTRETTEEERLKAEVSLSHVKLTMMQQTAKLGYFEWEPGDPDIDCSEQLYRNFGLEPFCPELTLARARQLIHPEDRDKVEIIAATFMRTGREDFSFRVNRHDGTIGWLYACVQSVHNAQDQLIRIFGTVQDQTEQKQTEARMTQAENDLVFTNEFYARCAHLNHLLINDFSAEYTRNGLNECGIATKEQYCCFVIQLHEKMGSAGAGIADQGAGKQEMMIHLAKCAWGWFWKFDDDLILLASQAERSLVDKQGQIAFAEKIIGEISRCGTGLDAYVGISGISAVPLDLRDLYNKARRALLVVVIQGEAPVVHYEDVGLYEIAFQLAQDPYSWQKAKRMIDKVEEYDCVRGGQLMKTLECILMDMSLKGIAERLYIHPNTALWRKRRLEKLLEVSLDRMEDRALVMLNLKIWKLKTIESF